MFQFKSTMKEYPYFHHRNVIFDNPYKHPQQIVSKLLTRYAQSQAICSSGGLDLGMSRWPRVLRLRLSDNNFHPAIFRLTHIVFGFNQWIFLAMGCYPEVILLNALLY